MSAATTTDYDAIADRYAADIDRRPWNALYERPATLALLPEVNGKDVLDAGCGHGWYAEQLVLRGARVVGFDRSARMAALAEARLGALFGEWARLLRPAGRVVLSTHHPMMHPERLTEPGYARTELMEESWG